jgi:hypothetical protein
MKGWFGEKLTFAWDWLSSGWGAAKEAVSKGWSSMKGWFGEKLTFAWDWLSSGWNTAEEAVS